MRVAASPCMASLYRHEISGGGRDTRACPAGRRQRFFHGLADSPFSQVNRLGASQAITSTWHSPAAISKDLARGPVLADLFRSLPQLATLGQGCSAVTPRPQHHLPRIMRLALTQDSPGEIASPGANVRVL